VPPRSIQNSQRASSVIVSSIAGRYFVMATMVAPLRVLVFVVKIAA
jgi:hypothetical protein